MSIYPAYKNSRISPYEDRPPSSRMSEDAHLKTSYEDLLAKAHGLHRNNSLANSILMTILDYVAGTGLTPTNTSAPMQRIWKQWSRRCDVTGVKSFKTVYREIIIGQVMGDVLLTAPLMTRLDDKVGLKTRLNVIPGSRVVSPRGLKEDTYDMQGRKVINGVCYDADGKEVGYYVVKDKGGISPDYSEVMYVPRYEQSGRFNAQLMRRPNNWPGRTRDLPLIAPIMQEIKDSADLWDASIKAAENKQKLSTYITTPRPTDLIPALGGIDSDGKAKTATSENGQVSYLGDIPDGAMMMLPPDSTINAVQTNGNTDLDTLFLRNNRYISAGIGGPMEIFFKDFSRVNFSSGKLAYDQFFREVDAWNAYNAEAIAEVYNWIMIEAVTRDMLSVQEYREGSIEDLQFIGAQTYVDADPGRNSGAEERRLSNNLVTQTEILAQKGKSYEDLIRTKARQIMIENAVALEEGVDPSLLRPQQSFDNEIMMEESIDE